MLKIPVTVLELSPEMKKDVVSSSQPLFEIFGTVSLSTWAASEVSDSMENNIISQTTEKYVLNKYLQIFVFSKNHRN